MSCSSKGRIYQYDAFYNRSVLSNGIAPRPLFSSRRETVLKYFFTARCFSEFVWWECRVVVRVFQSRAIVIFSFFALAETLSTILPLFLLFLITFFQFLYHVLTSHFLQHDSRLCVFQDPAIKLTKTRRDVSVCSHMQKELILAAIDMLDANSPTGGYLGMVMSQSYYC
jgi:hypothetical protein